MILERRINMIKKKKKKYRLKSSFKRFLIYCTFFLIVTIYAIHEAIPIYKEFKYKDTTEYKLTEVGYSKEEAQTFLKILDDEKIKFLLENKYNETYYPIITEKYYLNKNFSKYVEYKEYHEDTSYKDVIAIVNVNANLGWYNASFESNANDNYLILVNKFYHLNDTYKRDDLKRISLEYSYDNNSAAEIVIDNFNIMRKAILEELNIHLMINSSYRSYKDQEDTYNEYKKISLRYADTYASRPGYSEHQTGLSIDLSSLENKSIKAFTESQEYQWLIDNSYKYGFILRYPKDKEYITGYDTERCHFRYVGKDVAKIIHDEDITFDEYYAYYIAK